MDRRGIFRVIKRRRRNEPFGTLAVLPLKQAPVILRTRLREPALGVVEYNLRFANAPRRTQFGGYKPEHSIVPSQHDRGPLVG